MTSRPREHDQSERTAHPWAVAEPGSWLELAESTAFVFRAGGLALHPTTIALCGVGALACSWTLPIGLDSLLPWVGEHGVWGTLWAWIRLGWLVAVLCVCGTVMARMISARPTRAEVWGVMPSMLASAGLCVSTYLAVLVGTMLAAWLMWAVGGWIGGAFGGTLALLVGFAALVFAGLSTVLLLLAIPAIATNDADAPDAIQRAAAHLIARPGLSLALVGFILVVVLVLVWLVSLGLGVTFRVMSLGWSDVADLSWLPGTLQVFVGMSLGWAALTQALLTLREVVDREDRASCWDPRPQAEAIHQAIEARAVVSGGVGREAGGGSAG